MPELPMPAICRLDTPGGNGDKCFIQGSEELGPGETKTVRVRLTRKLPAALAGKLFGMRGYPGGFVEEGLGAAFDSARVNYLRISLAKPTTDHVLEVGNVRVGGRAPAPLPADPRQMFPMIDRYGQYMHSDWPGKVHNDAELAVRLKSETAYLAAHPGPDGWDRYGGWLAGPKIEATGFFRSEKYDGKWWLVDPDGRLFWSLGPDGVRPDECVTPITDRKHWFAELPASGSELAQFFGKGAWAPHGYYMGKQYETFCFSAANLLRKYGPDWRAVRHSRSPAIAQLGNEYRGQLVGPGCLLAAPHALRGEHQRPPQGASRQQRLLGQVRRRVRSLVPRGAARGHEARGGQVGRRSLVPGVLRRQRAGLGRRNLAGRRRLGVPRGPGRQACVHRATQETICGHRGVEPCLGNKPRLVGRAGQSRTPPDTKRAFADLAAFYTFTAEQYFRTCREAVKEVAPHNLYLGCRFAWVNDRAVRAAVKFCDVVSYNRYRDTVDDLQLPDGGDRPVIIGEFHFGALDRGLFHTGLRPVENQAARAQAFQRYLRSALATL